MPAPVVYSVLMRDDDDWLEETFPLGDGTADTSAEVVCPCCGAPGQLHLDPGGGPSQDYVEDCEVCCQPWFVRVRYQGGAAEVWLSPANE